VTSGSAGIQEAINDAAFWGGGVVSVDPSANFYLGGPQTVTTAMAAAVVAPGVTLRDDRYGPPTNWSILAGATTIAAPAVLTAVTAAPSDGSGNAVFNSVATVQNYTTVGIANDLTNYPANYYLAKIVVGASPGFSTAVAALTTDPPGTQVYPVASGGGAGTGASDLVVSGETTFPSTHGLTFDGAVTAAGDCVVESTTTAAAAHDTGVSCLYPSTLVGPLWVIGTLRNTVPVTGAQYVVDVHPFFIPGPLATLSEPSQTTGFSGATLCAATAAQCGAAGTYNIHWNIWQSGTGCSSPTNGASLTLTWTDAAGNSHTGILPELLVQYLTSPSLSGQMPFQGPGALGNAAASGDYTVNTNGSAITVSGSNNGGCGGGTATWNVLFTVERKH